VAVKKGMEFKGEQSLHWSCCGLQKGTSPDEATSSYTYLKELASQPENSLKFYVNLMEAFMVDMKTLLGLTMPNQSFLDVTK